jgi:putative transposase
MTSKFLSRNGETYRVLLENKDACWMISFDNPMERPLCIAASEMNSFRRVPAQQDFVPEECDLSLAAQKRLALIQPLLDVDAITDRQLRLPIAKDIAKRQNTTARRVLRLYYRYLATGQVAFSKNREVNVNKTYEWAIKTLYFSAKRSSLSATYDMMLVQKHTDSAGKLVENTPSWSSFRNYFYSRNYHKQPQKSIARSGLTNYQRNERPVFGALSDWRNVPGSYQMDATQADIYLVSRHDRSKMIGCPYIYLAVDTVTQLIAGLYVGLECDESAVMLCLANAAQDKVAFCREYRIEIAPTQWPSRGLPHEIITDKGTEFFGPRMQELCQKYGVEIQSLPPFRPDGKGLVEKSFDLIQQRYKPLLRGQGVIEPDAQERWAVDYRSQSVLNLDEFTQVVLRCVLYLNAGRTLSDVKTPAQKWLESDVSLLDVSVEEIYLMSLPREAAKLTRKGLRINGLLYVPTDLDRLMLDKTYDVAFSRSDLSCVYVLLDDCSFKPCWLSPHQSQYSGLSQPEANALKQHERKQRSTARKHEVSASVENIQSIRQIVRDATLAGSEKPSRTGKA